MSIKCLVDKDLLKKVEEARKEIYKAVEEYNCKPLMLVLPFITGPIWEVANRKWKEIED